MPIRIMHVVNNLGKGGLENGVANLIERMDTTRFEHVVCTLRGLGPNADRLSKDRVQVLALAEADSTSRFQMPALVRAIRRFQPDVVHSRNWAAIEAVMAARIVRSGAVVHSEHGFEAQILAREPWRRTRFRRVAYELADRVFSVSRQLRDLHTGRTGFPAHRMSVIHNGVDRNRFRPETTIRARVRSELQVVDTDLCIGCVANLLPVKDHVTLLKALMSLPASSRWRLLLIGEGAERGRLEQMVAERADWRERVTFLGSSDRVPELLQAMDVFVLPSLAEGICNSLLEAMACGLPVIATAVGGNPEVVIDGDSGRLFPVGDAGALAHHLRELETAPDLRRQMSQRALQRVRDEFSIETMVQAYERLYSGLRPAAAVPVLSAG